jgi:SulP family sulfate permease
VLSHNLAIGVVVGVLVAMVLFARRVAHLTNVEDVAVIDDDTHVYAVTGELFFATSNDLYSQFDYVNAPKNVVIDLSEAHIWDASTVAALDAITTKYHAKGRNVEIVGLNESSAAMHGRLSGHLGAGH